MHNKVDQLLAPRPHHDLLRVKVIKSIIFLVKIAYCMSQLLQPFVIKNKTCMYIYVTIVDQRLLLVIDSWMKLFLQRCHPPQPPLAIIFLFFSFTKSHFFLPFYLFSFKKWTGVKSMSDHFSNDTDIACKNQPYWKGVIILHQIKSIFFHMHCSMAL